MADIPSRELRNNVSGVLRRVERGESLRVTVSGRPVARLEPLSDRPQALPSAIVFAAIDRRGADPGLLHDLADALPDTTDDVDIA